MSGHMDSYRFGFILSLNDGISFKLIRFVKKSINVLNNNMIDKMFQLYQKSIGFLVLSGKI